MSFLPFSQNLWISASWEVLSWKTFPSSLVANASLTFSLSQWMQDAYIPTLRICLHCVGACSSHCAPFISEDILLCANSRRNRVQKLCTFIILASVLFKARSLAEWACLVNEAHCMGNTNRFRVQVFLLCYPVISKGWWYISLSFDSSI